MLMMKPNKRCDAMRRRGGEKEREKVLCRFLSQMNKQMNSVKVVSVCNPVRQLQGWYNYVFDITRDHVFALTHTASDKVIVVQLSATLGFPLIHQWELPADNDLVHGLYRYPLPWKRITNTRFAVWNYRTTLILMDVIHLRLEASLKGRFLSLDSEYLFFQTHTKTVRAFSLKHRQSFLVSDRFPDIQPCPYQPGRYLLLDMNLWHNAPRCRWQIVDFIPDDRTVGVQIHPVKKMTWTQPIHFLNWGNSVSQLLFQRRDGFIGTIDTTTLQIQTLAFDSVHRIEQVSGNNLRVFQNPFPTIPCDYARDLFRIRYTAALPCVTWQLVLSEQLGIQLSEQLGIQHDVDHSGQDDLVTQDNPPKWSGEIKDYDEKQALITELLLYLNRDLVFLVAEHLFWKPVAQHFLFSNAKQV